MWNPVQQLLNSDKIHWTYKNMLEHVVLKELVLITDQVLFKLLINIVLISKMSSISELWEI